MNFLLVGIGGFFGAMFRYSFYVLERSFKPHSFPWATFVINILGCFLAGLCITWIEQKFSSQKEVLLLVVVGFIGSYTTFSTFSVETLNLVRSGHITLAFIYLLTSMVLGVGAVWVGTSVNHDN